MATIDKYGLFHSAVNYPLGCHGPRSMHRANIGASQPGAGRANACACSYVDEPLKMTGQIATAVHWAVPLEKLQLVRTRCLIIQASFCPA